jgi:hypothetical protein
MNREYLNTVRFRHEPIVLRKPKNEKPIVLRKPKNEKLQREPRPAGSKCAVKAFYTVLLVVLSLIVFNGVVVGLINWCKDSEFVTIFDAYADFLEYVEENR